LRSEAGATALATALRRIKGEKPRTRTFKRLTDAKAWVGAVETDLGRGAFVPTTVDRRRTLADLIDKYLKEHLPVRRHNADERMTKTHLAWWKENAGYVTLDKLTGPTIAGFRSELLARRTARTVDGEAREVPITQATANRYLAALSAVCKWASKELGWLSSNPVLSVTKGAEHTGIVRYLDDAERRALLAACKASTDRNIATAVAIALATGAGSFVEHPQSDLGRRRPRALAFAVRAHEERSAAIRPACRACSSNPASALRSRPDAKRMGIQGAE